VAINSLPPVNFRQFIETTAVPGGKNMLRTPPNQPTDRQTNYSNFQISSGGSFRWPGAGDWDLNGGGRFEMEMGMAWLWSD